MKKMQKRLLARSLGERRYRFNRPLLALATLLLGGAIGCGSGHPQTIPRQLAGATRQGPFVSPYAYEWFLRGEQALQVGDYDAAQEAFHRAEAWGPEDPLVMARVAESYAHLGDTAFAERWLTRGLERFPQSESLWRTRAKLARMQGDAAGTESALVRAYCIAPSSEQAVMELAASLGSTHPEHRAPLLRTFRLQTGSTYRTATAEFDAALAAIPVSLGHAAEAMHYLLAHTPGGRAHVERGLAALRDNNRTITAGLLVSLLEPAAVSKTLRIGLLADAGLVADASRFLEEHGASSTDDTIRLWMRLNDTEKARLLAEREYRAAPTLRHAWRLARIETAHPQREVVLRGAARLAAIPPTTTPYPEAQQLLREVMSRERLSGLARAF